MSRLVNVSFGKAIELLKDGKKVCWEGWNGKDMGLICRIV